MSLSLLTRSYLASLVTEGLLSGNNLLFEGQPVGGGDTTPAPSGWDFANAHPETGCPKSHGIEALKNKLVNLGHSPLARLIPTFHVADFWREDNFDWSFTDLTDRFAFPSDFLDEYGLTPQQAALITSNLLGVNSLMFNLTWIGGGDRIKNMYRGEANGIGFDPNNTTYGNGQDRGLNPNPKPVRPGVGYVFNGPDPGHHFVYDIYFDAFNDADIVRYWTSWARAWGAAV